MAGSSSKIRTRRRFTREARAGLGFAAPFFVFFALSFLVPIVVSLWDSLFRQQLADGGFGGVVNKFVGLKNYADVLSMKDFWVGFGNVAYYGVIKIPLVMISALVLVLLLDSLAATGVKIFRLLYFLPYAIPGVVAAIVWTNLYSPNLSPLKPILHAFGLPANFFTSGMMLTPSMANITAWTFIGYNMIIFMATLKAIPTELYEAAHIDGASEWQIVWYIKLPNLRGAAVVTILMSLIGTVQWFNEPMVLRTMVPKIQSSYTPMMIAYQQAFDSNDTGLASATSILMAVVAGILAAIWLWYQSRAAKKNGAVL